jgi:hypothetical protein
MNVPVVSTTEGAKKLDSRKRPHTYHTIVATNQYFGHHCLPYVKILCAVQESITHILIFEQSHETMINPSEEN